MASGAKVFKQGVRKKVGLSISPERLEKEFKRMLQICKTRSEAHFPAFEIHFEEHEKSDPSLILIIPLKNAPTQKKDSTGKERYVFAHTFADDGTRRFLPRTGKVTILMHGTPVWDFEYDEGSTSELYVKAPTEPVQLPAELLSAGILSAFALEPGVWKDEGWVQFNHMEHPFVLQMKVKKMALPGKRAENVDSAAAESAAAESGDAAAGHSVQYGYTVCRLAVQMIPPPTTPATELELLADI